MNLEVKDFEGLGNEKYTLRVLIASLAVITINIIEVAAKCDLEH